MGRYEEALGQLAELAEKGLSAAVYTQITDIEGEVNGLLTYDRNLFKIDVDRAAKAAAKLEAVLKDNNMKQ